MIQAADGDVPWEINPEHSQRAPEILIMPPKKREKQDKSEKRCHINNSYATTEQCFFTSAEGLSFPNCMGLQSDPVLTARVEGIIVAFGILVGEREVRTEHQMRR